MQVAPPVYQNPQVYQAPVYQTAPVYQAAPVYQTPPVVVQQGPTVVQTAPVVVDAGPRYYNGGYSNNGGYGYNGSPSYYDGGAGYYDGGARYGRTIYYERGPEIFPSRTTNTRRTTPLRLRLRLRYGYGYGGTATATARLRRLARYGYGYAALRLHGYGYDNGYGYAPTYYSGYAQPPSPTTAGPTIVPTTGVRSSAPAAPMKPDKQSAECGRSGGLPTSHCREAAAPLGRRLSFEEAGPGQGRRPRDRLCASRRRTERPIGRSKLCLRLSLAWLSQRLAARSHCPLPLKRSRARISRPKPP